MFAASDIAAVPADVLKYILITLGWLATTGAAIYGGARWSKKGTKESPVSIEQPLDVRKHDAPARKSEHDTLRAAVVALDNKITASLITRGEDALALSQQLTTLKEELSDAGDKRASAITQNIDVEIARLSTRIGNLAEALHEKINKAVVDNARQGSDISHLKSEAFRHTNEISAIRTAIQDLLKSDSKAKR